MDEQTWHAHDAPLIIRRVPAERVRLACAVTGLRPDGAGTPSQIWWELVDPAAASVLEPVAAALTAVMPDGVVRLVAAGAARGARPRAVEELLRSLIASLRGHGVDLVVARSGDPDLVASLLGVGFTRLSFVGETFVLAL